MGGNGEILSDIERPTSLWVIFGSFIAYQTAALGHMLQLNTNRKSYMGSSMALSHLTLSDLKRLKWRSLWFRRLISRIGTELGHLFLLNTIRKSYGESNTTIRFDFEWFTRSRGLWRFVSRKGGELDHVLLLNTKIHVVEHPLYTKPVPSHEHHRIAFSRLRLESHKLRVKTGRWSRIPRHLRICDKCDSKNDQTEEHVLCHCLWEQPIKKHYKTTIC